MIFWTLAGSVSLCDPGTTLGIKRSGISWVSATDVPLLTFGRLFPNSQDAWPLLDCVSLGVVLVAEANLPLELTKDSHHKSFESGWRVAQPKGHHLEKPQAPRERGPVFGFF